MLESGEWPRVELECTVASAIGGGVRRRAAAGGRQHGGWGGAGTIGARAAGGPLQQQGAAGGRGVDEGGPGGRGDPVVREDAGRAAPPAALPLLPAGVLPPLPGAPAPAPHCTGSEIMVRRKPAVN